MIGPAATRSPSDKSLAQQERDFTSEGAPPPGVVARSVPVAEDKPTKARSPARATVPGAHKAAPSDSDR